MSLAAPLWLLALLPWAALVVWMLRGRHDAVEVPFLRLWSGAPVTPTRSRAIRIPPVAVIAALLAALLALLAAARPTVEARGAARVAITLILDRGLATWGVAARRNEIIDRVRRLRPSGASADFDVVVRTVPPTPLLGGSPDSVADALSAIAPVASDTRPELLAILNATTRDEAGGRRIVATAQPIELSDDRRTTLLRPRAAIENVGIVSVAARAGAAPQVMVTMRNDSSRTSADLIVLSGKHETKTAVTLGLRGGEERHFIDLSTIDRAIEVRLNVEDDLAADNRAWLTRTRSWPRVERRAALDLSTIAAIDAYRTARPPSPQSAIVAVVPESDLLPPESAAVMVAPSSVHSAPAGERPRVADHPITANVGWVELLAGAGIADGPPSGMEWTPLVTVENRPVVAMAAGAVRRVWVGFAAVPQAARSQDFVIFWTNLLDWAGQGADEFTSSAPRALGEGWQSADAAHATAPPGMWPGLYRREDGALLAVNAAPVSFAESAASTGQATPLEQAFTEDWVAQGRRVQLAPMLSLASAAALLAGLLASGRTRLDRFFRHS